MPQTFIYVSCAASRTIDVFSLDNQTGQPELRQRLSLPAKPTPLRRDFMATTVFHWLVCGS